MRRAWTAVLVLGVTLAAAGPASAVLPAGNLVVNPGAEDGPADTSTTTGVVAIPGWNTQGPFTVLSYTGSDAGLNATAAEGQNFFAGGPGQAAGSASQPIDVSAAAPEIDSGHAAAFLSGELGGVLNQGDSATVIATYLNSIGVALGATAIGPVTAADRGGVSKLMPRSNAAAVPVGTRRIVVTIYAARNDDDFNDAFADNIALSLGPGPPPAPQPVFNQSAVVRRVSGTVYVRLPGSPDFVPLDQASAIPMGSVLDTTDGRISLSAAASPNGGTASANFFSGEFAISQIPGNNPLTRLTLMGSRVSRATVAAKKRKARRALWGDGKGHFQTKGEYSSATVRGTRWYVADRTDGTYTRVRRGSVTVRDLRRNRTRVVRAGQSYLVRR